ncbi:putative Ubiquitin-like superfamily protein [Hibiscus syriacus]|uniref:Ubiquitin-like superfamily protein n=1 Tax=Hibiscus syriacus TaxID=106335 RepID=A0A6A3BZI6_HIBSY|nr:putative Ubiquitin-like superfamily protein [Hibiscus syriacus]
MDILIFFSCLYALLHAAAAAAEPCSITRCGRNEVPIRFPFRQQGKQPESCGYPGFNLGCRNIYDPDDCLPRRLLSFNLSGSPFVAVFHQNYTFLSCPTQVTNSRLNTIGCLSNSTHSVLATSSINLANRMASSSCRIISTLPIPVSGPAKSEEGFTAELGADIQLTWYAPQCVECEEQGGICGLKNHSSEEIDCFNLPESGGRSEGLRVFRIICLSIAIPSLSCAVGIAVFACFFDRNVQRNNSPTAVLPQPMVSATGLDESTIESYEKMVVGDSRRIPGPNDATCPICLSEYRTTETIRCIPECKHCFHAECIDEWLRLNTSCPVCRNNPSTEDAGSRDDPV